MPTGSSSTSLNPPSAFDAELRGNVDAAPSVLDHLRDHATAGEKDARQIHRKRPPPFTACLCSDRLRAKIAHTRLGGADC
jgi:hypothetical protein